MNKDKRVVGKYEIKETLGKGGYSWVKMGVHEETGAAVALKFMSRADKSWEKEQERQVQTEISSMVKIKSEHVMRLFAYNLNCQYPARDGTFLKTILLVMELCPGGELFDILFYTQQLDAKTARTYFIQMIHGLKACHDAGIVHRDLKPQNLLMDARYQLKITDFGLSKVTRDADKAVMKTHYVGTRGYQAPELLKKRSYGKACDIFSAGVVLFILLTGYPPFEQAVKQDKWYLPMALDKPDKFWKQHEGCGVKPDARELITQMIAYHASKRIDIDQILKSDFCKGETHTPEELYTILRKRHRETRKRRKNDKNKMKDLEHSVKRGGVVFSEALKQLSSIPCPMRKYKARQSFMTNRWLVRPNLEDQVKLEEQKDDIPAIPKEVIFSYLEAIAALKCDGKSKITLVKENPWNVLCKASDMDGYKYQIEMNIHHDENDVYHFNFRFVSGDKFRLHKFWKSCEAYLIHSKYFTDELDEEDEWAAGANEVDDEKQERLETDDNNQDE